MFIMGISLTQRLKLKKFIRDLEQYRGRHTELVSVYIPPGSELVKTIQQLQDEQGTATNIKDKNTSKAVITALERMIRTLKTFSGTPKNGLAIFSGNISEKDNVDNCQVFYIEPPEPINIKLYRCDQRFILDPLKELASNETTFGLIAIDKGEATVGLLIGSTIKVIKQLTSTVPGKFKAGGQSAQRFERIREGAAIEFYKRVADACIQEFTFMKELKGIIIGGPGTTKQNFFTGNYLNQEIKQKVLGLKDITYTNTYGLTELVEVSEDLLTETEVMEERTILKKYLEALSKTPSMGVYGYKNTLTALEMAAVEDLIIIDSMVTDEQLEELSALQESTGATLHIVTDKTSEGVQLKGLTGVGAILRYPIEH
jgi:peptide chain release factor subunit 1